MEKVAQAAVSLLVGGAVTWGANVLTLAGRVDALEAGQRRIEVLLVQALRVPAMEQKP